MKKNLIRSLFPIIIMIITLTGSWVFAIEAPVGEMTVEEIMVHSFSLINNLEIGQEMGLYSEKAVGAYEATLQAYLNKGTNVTSADKEAFMDAYQQFVTSRYATQSELDAYNQVFLSALDLIDREAKGTGVFFTPEAYFALQASLEGYQLFEAGRLVVLNDLLQGKQDIEQAINSYLTPRNTETSQLLVTEAETILEDLVESSEEESLELFVQSLEDLGDNYNELEGDSAGSKDLLNVLIDVANTTIAKSGQVAIDDEQIIVDADSLTVQPKLEDVLQAIDRVKATEKTIEAAMADKVEEGLETAVLKTLTIRVPKKTSETPKASVSLSKEVLDVLKEEKVDKLRLDLGSVQYELSKEFMKAHEDKGLAFSAKEDAPITSESQVENSEFVTTTGLPTLELEAVQNSQTDDSFDYPLTLSFDVSDVTDLSTNELFVVHRFNEASNTWEPVHGFYDPIKKRIIVRRGHLSKYTVLKSKQNLSHIEDSWAKEEIAALLSTGVINDETLLDPKSNISREEFSSWIVKAYGLDGESIGESFKDIDESNPYYNSINIAYELGIVTGYEDGTFKPDSDITREEMAMIIGSAIKAYNQTIDTDSFDLAKYEEDIPSWAINSVETVVENGLTTEDYFVVNGNVSVEEAASILYNVNNIYR